MTLEEKLQHFYDRSMEDAQAEGEKILDDYQASLDQLFEEHKAEKEASAKNRVEAERASCYRESNKELAGRQIRIRHELAEKQNEIQDEIFEEVEKQLLAFKEKAEYTTWIVRKIETARQVAGVSPMEIYLDPSDAALQSAIEAKTKEKLIISNTSFIGGVRVVIREQKILMDDSFAALMEDAKEGFSFEGGVRA